MAGHIEKAISRLDPARYTQEPEYMAALLARLDGLVFQDKKIHVEIISTIVTDPGPKAAESRFGADFVFTASLQIGDQKIQKVVLGRAKRGPLENQSVEQKEIFQEQCNKMLRESRQGIILETPLEGGQFPMVKILGPENSIPIKDKIQLAEYLIVPFMGCLHGDARGFFVRDILESHLPKLHISAHAVDSIV